MPTPKVGGIIGFAVKKLSCIGCKAPLTDGEYTTCSQCRHKEPELYQTQLSTVRSLESQFSRAWTQCQVCQGSLHQTVLCTSRDCPIFYMRKKVQKDLGDAQEMLQRFDLSWWNVQLAFIFKIDEIHFWLFGSLKRMSEQQYNIHIKFSHTCRVLKVIGNGIGVFYLSDKVVNFLRVVVLGWFWVKIQSIEEEKGRLE